MKPILCTVGATHEGGIVELLAPARMVYVTALTDIATGVPLTAGRKVLVTLTGKRDDQHRELVASVRAVGPTEEQVRELVALNKKLAELALPTPSRGEELNWLTKRYEQILANDEAADDLVLRGLIDEWQQYDLRFPRTSWSSDLTPGIDEMAEHLRRHGLPYDIDAEPLNVKFDERMMKGASEEAARRDTITELAAIANERAASAGKPERFFGFADLAWDDDPLWLWLSPTQAETLVALDLLRLND
ncbi:MAG: hypothetical protein ACO1OB_00205 [Archangium sp.]